MKNTLLLTALAAALLPLHAENWSQWRGPNHDGSTTEKNLPATFSKTENVRWAADLPGPSAATPVVHGDRVFVSSTDAQTKSVLALCFDRKSGKELWRQPVAEGFNRDDRSNYASPSPVSDGSRVIFFYGTGDLVAFTHDGKKIWHRNVQKDHGGFAFLWTFSTTPLLHDGRLYLQVLQRDTAVSGRGHTDKPNDSYLLAMDPATGRDLWRHVRPSDAKSESLEAFSSPVPATHAGRTELLITGGDCITGHDPKTGKELWRWGTWNPNRIGHWRLVPSPVVGEGIALACGPKGAPVCAVKLGQNGTLPDGGTTWQSTDKQVSSDVSTPLFYQGRFYVLNSDRKSLACVEPATGRVVWSQPLGSKSKIEGSPTAGDGKIYVMNMSGEVYVVAAGDEFKPLHTTRMAEDGEKDLRACIALSQGNAFIRTAGKLYCVGAK